MLNYLTLSTKIFFLMLTRWHCVNQYKQKRLKPFQLFFCSSSTGYHNDEVYLVFPRPWTADFLVPGQNYFFSSNQILRYISYNTSQYLHNKLLHEYILSTQYKLKKWDNTATNWWLSKSFQISQRNILSVTVSFTVEG